MFGFLFGSAKNADTKRVITGEKEPVIGNFLRFWDHNGPFVKDQCTSPNDQVDPRIIRLEVVDPIDFAIMSRYRDVTESYAARVVEQRDTPGEADALEMYHVAERYASIVYNMYAKKYTREALAAANKPVVRAPQNLFEQLLSNPQNFLIVETIRLALQNPQEHDDCDDATIYDSDEDDTTIYDSDEDDDDIVNLDELDDQEGADSGVSADDEDYDSSDALDDEDADSSDASEEDVY